MDLFHRTQLRLRWLGPGGYDSVALSLRRMNQILEINEAAGYALLEPGVSFFDLYNEIKAPRAEALDLRSGRRLGCVAKPRRG